MLRIPKEAEHTRIWLNKDSSQIVRATILANPMKKYKTIITVKYLKSFLYHDRTIREKWIIEKYYTNSTSFNYLMRRGRAIIRRRMNLQDIGKKILKKW